MLLTALEDEVARYIDAHGEARDAEGRRLSFATVVGRLGA